MGRHQRSTQGRVIRLRDSSAPLDCSPNRSDGVGYEGAPEVDAALTGFRRCRGRSVGGREVDEFPALYAELIAPADIVVLASSIGLGDQTSVTRLVIERLYGFSGQLNGHGQWSYYGKVGGVPVTGNEDGGKHCAAQMLYALSHVGFTIPPQVDAYWVRGSRAGPVLSRPAGRCRQCVDDPQHRLRGLERAAHSPDAHGRRGRTTARQRHHQLGPVQPVGAEPRVPVRCARGRTSTSRRRPSSPPSDVPLTATVCAGQVRAHRSP